jgi:hypothetical protein
MGPDVANPLLEGYVRGETPPPPPRTPPPHHVEWLLPLPFSTYPIPFLCLARPFLFSVLQFRYTTIFPIAKTTNWRRGLARIPTDPVREPEDSSVRFDGLVQRRDRHQCAQQVRGCDPYIHTCRWESVLHVEGCQTLLDSVVVHHQLSVSLVCMSL